MVWTWQRGLGILDLDLWGDQIWIFGGDDGVLGGEVMVLYFLGVLKVLEGEGVMVVWGVWSSDIVMIARDKGSLESLA